MGVTVRSVKVKLGLDISEFNRNALGAAASAKGIPDSLAASSAKARTELSSLERELQKIAQGRYDATVSLEDRDAAARLDALRVRLDQFGTTVTDARVDVDDAEALAKISSIEAALLGLAHTTADPNIDLQGVAKAEAQIAALEAQLNSIGSGENGGLRGFIDGLDDSNSRMSNLIQTAVALGPALIPVLGGAAVGAAALGTSLTFAATGAGVAALALHGVSDSLSALNKYQMDPTQANLDALRLKLQELGPAGQNFVFFLESLKPKLDQLQATAQAGFLPGLQSGIEQVSRSFPAVNALVGDLATTLGGLADEAGHALESPFWQGFLETFSQHASAELSKFAEGIGNVTTGLAGMFEAFLPVSSDFTSELLQMSQSFSDWGQNLSQNQGFQDFVTYIRDNGPHAAEALAAIAQAFISIIKAGAPVGSIVLPIITDLAKALSAIAESPAGPVLFGLAAAMSALGRSLAVMKALNATAILGPIASLGGGMTRQAAQMQLLAGGVAALVLSLTSLDDQAGVSNTLMGGALGFAVRGGWGAAIGATIGLTKDLASANDDLEKSMGNVDDAFTGQTVSFTAARDALDELIKKRDDYQAKLQASQDVPHGGVSFDPHVLGQRLTGFLTQGFTSFSDFLTNTSHESQVATDEATKNLDNLKGALTELAAEAGGSKADFAGLGDTISKLGFSAKSIGDLFANRNRSAPDAVAWQTAAHAIADYNAAQDSVPGRTKAVNDAIAALDDPLKTTAEAATALKDAMDALFGPELSLSAATDQWAADLAHLDDNLAKHTKTLTGQTEGARKNREVIRGLVSDLIDVANAGAGVGESASQFNQRLQDMYQNLIKTGVAAGLNKKQFQGYLSTLNLTPAELHTLVRLFGKQQAQKQVQDLVSAYNALPLDVRTDIAANGIDADATVKSLMAKYDGLSRKDVETILAVRDNASGPINAVRINLNSLDGTVATTYINTVVTQTQITKVLTQLGSPDVPKRARGGWIDGPGTETSDSIPYGDGAVSRREFVVNADSAEANAALLERINASHGPLSNVVQWAANGGIGLRGNSGAGSTTTHVTQMLPDTITVRIGAEKFDAYVDRRASKVTEGGLDGAASYTARQRRARPS